LPRHQSLSGRKIKNTKATGLNLDRSLNPLVLRWTLGCFAIVATRFDNRIEAQNRPRGKSGFVLQTGQTSGAISILGNGIQLNAYLRSPGLLAGFFVCGSFEGKRGAGSGPRFFGNPRLTFPARRPALAS
jgi:hypothetical protein